MDYLQFRNDQKLVGTFFKTVLKVPSRGDPPVISQEQADAARDNAEFDMPDQLKTAYNAIRDIDVVAASAQFSPEQQEDINDRDAGIPQLRGPFNQVVLLTPDGKLFRSFILAPKLTPQSFPAAASLSFVRSQPLDECLKATGVKQALKKLKSFCSGMMCA